MFAYWLRNLLKAAKNQKLQTTTIIPKAIIGKSIHHFYSQPGMLFIGANEFNTGRLKQTMKLMVGMDNDITVSG